MESSHRGPGLRFPLISKKSFLCTVLDILESKFHGKLGLFEFLAQIGRVGEFGDPPVFNDHPVEVFNISSLLKAKCPSFYLLAITQVLGLEYFINLPSPKGRSLLKTHVCLIRVG